MKLLTPDNDIIQEISCKDNGVSIVTKMPGTQSEVQATYGQAVEQKYLDGRPIKVLYLRVCVVSLQSASFLSCRDDDIKILSALVNA